MKNIIGYVEYVVGHLRSGSFNLRLSDNEYENFQKMSEEEKLEWIRDEGSFEVDDYYLSDVGPITEYEVYNEN